MDDQQNNIPGFNPLLEKDDNILVGDNYEFLTKFATEQNLKHYGYGDELEHINKNLIYTSLSRKLGEVETVQIYSEIITLLKRHLRNRQVAQDTGTTRLVEIDGKAVEMPIYTYKETDYYRFYKLINYFSSRLYSLTSAAAGANSELIKMLKSQFITKEHSIEDKTETKTGIWGKPKKTQER